MRVLSITVSLFLCLWLVLGCASTAPKKEKAAVAPPSFDFTPPSQAEVASAGVVLALVSPSYAEEEAVFDFYPFTDFSRNMEGDFEELLIARGFTVTGPFEAYDEMTFPDKNGCDLVLNPSLDISVNFSNTTSEQVIMLFGDNQFKLKGQVSVRGRIKLQMYESLSGEKMWTKSINIAEATQAVNWKGEKKYSHQPSSADIDYSDQGIQKALAPMLSNAYSAVMDAAWKYLHPEEIQIVKKEAMQVKEKKRY